MPNPARSAPEEFSLASVIVEHKRGAAAIAVVVLALIAVTIVPSLTGSSSAALSDSASCSQWAAATPGEQDAYARLYLNEYLAVPDTPANVTTVRARINNACVRAAYLGEADEVTVVAAFRHQF